MRSETMKPCCMVLTILMFLFQCSHGFVVVSQPRARLATSYSRRNMLQAPSYPSSPTSRRRKGRRSKPASGRGRGGVRSLSVGMEMPGLELIAGFLDGPAAAILEQSSRHHYPSAFIGGTVGVLGTLTAIKVGPWVLVLRIRGMFFVPIMLGCCACWRGNMTTRACKSPRASAWLGAATTSNLFKTNIEFNAPWIHNAV